MTIKNELRYIGKKIVENNQKLADIVQKVQTEQLNDVLNQFSISLSKRKKYREDLICLLGESLYEDSHHNTQKVLKWADKAGKAFILENLPLNDALQALSSYRTVIWDVFSEELERNQFSAATMLEVSRIIDPLLDKISRTFGQLYDKHNQHLMNLAYSALEELSVPVVPIFEDIAVVPLVGAIDTHRAQLIMEVALTEGARLKLNHIILDVSGVPIIDTMVADQLFHIVRALRLSGIHVVVTGVRPEIAQTIVSLGVSFGNIQTRANMKQALQALGYKKRE